MKSYWDLKNLEWREFGKKLWRQVRDDHVTGHAAQVAYFLALSIFPMLLFLTALLGLFLEGDQVLRETLQNQLRRVAPGSALDLLMKVLEEISAGAGAGKISFGLLFSLWVASHGVRAIMISLNVAYGVAEARVWWKQQLVALMLTAGLLLFSFLALMLTLYGPKLLDFIASRAGLSALAYALWSILRWILLLAFILTVFNSLYLFAPNVKHKRWHWLMPGTVAAAAIWLAASFGFKAYLSFWDRYSATYGSIGAVIILLLWLYIAGIAILIGGEINSEIQKRFGAFEEKKRPRAS